MNRSANVLIRPDNNQNQINRSFSSNIIIKLLMNEEVFSSFPLMYYIIFMKKFFHIHSRLHWHLSCKCTCHEFLYYHIQNVSRKKFSTFALLSCVVSCIFINLCVCNKKHFAAMHAIPHHYSIFAAS